MVDLYAYELGQNKGCQISGTEVNSSTIDGTYSSFIYQFDPKESLHSFARRIIFTHSSLDSYTRWQMCRLII